MKDIIEAAFEDRANINPQSVTAEVKQAVNEAIRMLDSGEARVAEQKGVGDWVVNEWLKKAVLLSFRIEDNVPMQGGFTQYYDKVLQNLPTCQLMNSRQLVCAWFHQPVQDAALTLPKTRY